ncbi:Asp23/Gls24 family envelope stress response protein [Corynebacterium pyruviciproducens]
MTTPETTTPFTGAALPEVAKVPEDFSNKRGMNHFSERALSTIIQQAILSVPGVVQRSSGLEKITGRSYPRFNIDADEPTDSVSIDSTIAVTWPSPVTAVAETVRDTVRTWVTRLTGITNVSVNVAVGPVVNAPTRVQMNHLLSFGLEPTPVPVRYTETTPVSPTVKPQKGLRPIDRGHLPELMPIDPGREVTLRAIDAGTIPEAWVPDIPAPRFVRPTSLPNAKPVPLRHGSTAGHAGYATREEAGTGGVAPHASTGAGNFTHREEAASAYPPVHRGNQGTAGENARTDPARSRAHAATHPCHLAADYVAGRACGAAAHETAGAQAHHH